jgi:DNA-binding YbaB/EbfC family protein
MSPPDMNEVLAQAQQMQARMTQLQRDLALRSFEGSAGGGMVTATATGELRVTGIAIEQALLDGGDREMIQDLTAAAVNAALSNAQRTVQEEFQKLSGGLSLPGMGG